MRLHSAYIGLGSNQGDARANVLRAIDRLAALPDCSLSAKSSLFRSAPVEAQGDDFVNAVACIATKLDALPLLAALRAIETEFGRERPYPNAPRSLDLDLLLYGSQRINLPELTVPHPRMTQRAFVLIPLLQIDPFIDIPGKGAAHHFVPALADQLISKLAD
jgi:2-amino-4-hydroxy-6-hydroxymethyldihydropteridine diphosphokinase